MKDSLMQNLGLVHLQGLVSSLVLVLLTVCRGDSVQVVGQPEPVVALIGDDVILPCFLNPKSDASSQSVRWRQQSEEVHLYRSKVDANDDQNPVYRLRTSLFKEELKNGNVSLKLNNVKLSDAGTYSCQVPTLDKDQKAFVQLVVDTVFPMTRGQKAGIIIGVIIAVTILSVAGGVYMWRQKKQLKQQQEEQSIIFVDHNRNDLIQRVTKVIPITEELLQMGLIQKEDQSTITAPKTSQDQMGKLYQVLQEGGDKTKSAFYKILLKQEPNLLKELDVNFVDKYKDDLIQWVDEVKSISMSAAPEGFDPEGG
ncbi:hypothetical protein UPYG_G00247090 [Umbra pygmaea]|uniref:Uncharacterized protein n=1 Tax=Umbra pygmaea TaxID=75934 RepID=A0ABD0WHA9_UMBPY